MAAAKLVIRAAGGVRRGFLILEEALLCVLLLAMIVLACVQIVLRGVLSSGLLWADPLLRYMVLWAGLLGAAVATKQGKHIAIDIISHLVSGPVLSWLRVVIDLFSAAVCAVLTYAAFVFVKNEAAFGGGREVLGIPSWGMNLIFPVVFAVIALRFLLNAIVGARHNVTPTGAVKKTGGPDTFRQS